MQAATNKGDTDRNKYPNLHSNSGGMTPSIITTINNTSPTPPTNNNNNINNANNRANNKRSTVEPYESYIEDSFVGHWEREDDDPTEEYKMGHGGENSDGAEDGESTLHPSTIEFDFDSFGPESFIYTPASSKHTPTVDKDSNLSPNVDAAPNSSSLEARRCLEKSKITLDGQQVQLDNEKSHDCTKDFKQIQDVTTTTNTNTNIAKPCTPNPNPLDYLVETAQIDLKVIEPYKKVISHAGYCHHFDPSAPGPKPGEPAPAIIVFSACYLPDRSRRDYNYVMDHLFLYVLSSLHELIADDYILIYLHNTQPSTLTSSLSSRTSTSSNLANGSTSSNCNDDLQHQNNLPTFTWMKRCYQMIDRKLRKNLKILYLVKPTFWLKTIVIMCRPFISGKFSKKLRFVEDMNGLKRCLPLDQLILPASAENI